VPVIGYSHDMARGGALLGAEPDYFELGRQAGETAARVARDLAVAPFYPTRRFRFACNARVARLMGLKMTVPKAGLDLVVLR
jgi:ABC-type uncharacterized transport system substrate-binding protein